jgi:hypothetical protein
MNPVKCHARVAAQKRAGWSDLSPTSGAVIGEPGALVERLAEEAEYLSIT